MSEVPKAQVRLQGDFGIPGFVQQNAKTAFSHKNEETKESRFFIAKKTRTQLSQDLARHSQSPRGW